MNCEQVSVCRLCGSSAGIHVHIFDGPERCLSKIESIVPDVVILRYDSLPKNICHLCLTKVKDFHDFRERCLKTQTLLKRQYLPWNSEHLPVQHNSCARDVPSPTVLYLGGPLAYPFGDKEVEVLTVSDDEAENGSQKSSRESGPIFQDKELNDSSLQKYNCSLDSSVQTNWTVQSEIARLSKPPPLTRIPQRFSKPDFSTKNLKVSQTGVQQPLQQSAQTTSSEQNFVKQTLYPNRTVFSPSTSSGFHSHRPSSVGSSKLERTLKASHTEKPNLGTNTYQFHVSSGSKSSEHDMDITKKTMIRRPKPKPKCKQKSSSQSSNFALRRNAGSSCINLAPNSCIFTCNNCNEIFLHSGQLEGHCCNQMKNNDKLMRPVDNVLFNENSDDSSNSVELLD